MRTLVQAALLAASASLLAAGNAVAAAGGSHVIYLNNCKPNGCTIHAGVTDATTDTSDIPGQTSTVMAFDQSPAVWSDVLTCMRGVMAPFDVLVTDQRPASGDFFEVVVAGSSVNLGLSAGILADSDTACTGVGSCVQYVPNELAFVFANAAPFDADANAICDTAAQALGVGWALDFVLDAADVMHSNAPTGIRGFHDAEACGGDCTGSTSLFGETCSGTGPTATHVCIGNGAGTQDEAQTVLALFGSAPAVSITAPASGATVESGFSIETTCTSGSGVQNVTVAIDSSNQVTLTAPPYTTTAPATLAAGPHSIVATCTSVAGLTASASSTVDLQGAGGGGGGSKGCSCELGASSSPLTASVCAIALASLVGLALRRFRSRAG